MRLVAEIEKLLKALASAYPADRHLMSPRPAAPRRQTFEKRELRSIV